MTQRKIIYSEIALTKRKAIKRDIKEKYVQEIADTLSEQFKISGFQEKFFHRTSPCKKNTNFPLTLTERHSLQLVCGKQTLRSKTAFRVPAL